MGLAVEMSRFSKVLEAELDDLREEVRLTLLENLHLADGDVCTLKRLKDAIRFELEDFCENETSPAAGGAHS